MNKLLAILLCSTMTSVFADTVDFKKYVFNSVPQEWTVYFDKKIGSLAIETKTTWEQTLTDVVKTQQNLDVHIDQETKTVRIKKIMTTPTITQPSKIKTEKADDCCNIPATNAVAQLQKQTSNSNSSNNKNESVLPEVANTETVKVMSAESSKTLISWNWQKSKSIATNLRELSVQNGYIFTEKSWQVYMDGEFSDFMLDTSEIFTAPTVEDVYAQILKRVEYLGLKACFFENNYIKIINRKESNGDTKCIEN